MSTETDETKANDPVYAEACGIVKSTGKTNISHLQRVMRIGYNRAARLIEAMETDGIVSHADQRGVRTLLLGTEAPPATNPTEAIDSKIQEDIGHVVTSMISRFDAELLATPENELEKRWYFKWDDKAGVEWNTYKFSDMLEGYKRSCRKWEEHHNGSCCVVERVRDKYLMPKVREFLAALQGHTNLAAEESERTSKCSARYEAVRKLNARQFADLCRNNIEIGVPFDQLVDGLISAGEKR